MASVYILYSRLAGSYYIGSCKDLKERLEQHLKKEFTGFTSNQDDWQLFYSIDGLEYKNDKSWLKSKIDFLKTK